MTALLPRPILRVEPTAEPPAGPLILAAWLVGLGAAGVGVLVCVAVSVATWFAAGAGSIGSAIRVGALGWLLANGSGLQAGGVSIGAIPLGAGLLSAWVLYRGGRWAGRHSAVGSLLDVGAGAGAIGAGYCLAGLAAYAVTRSDSVHAYPLRTLVGALAVATLFGGLGVLRGAGMSGLLLDRLPVELRAVLTGGLAGLAVMVAAGAVAFAVSIGQHLGTATTLFEGLHAGLVGGVVMAVVTVAAVPNAVLCAGAFVAGPGFMLGTATSVGPTQVTLGPLPAFPLLAAVPHTAAGPWVVALLIIPVIAGAVAGSVSLRRRPVRGIGHAAARGGVAGVTFGLGFGALTWLATGAVGPGRMRDIGPDVLGTMAVCVAAGILGGAVTAACIRSVSTLRSREHPPPPAEEPGSSAEEPGLSRSPG